jgi:MFS family permease
MRFFRSYAFASGVASSFFFYASMYGILFFLPQFLQTAQGHAPFGVGVRLLPWTATLFVVAPVAGKLVNRIGERPLVVTGLILQALGMAWIGLIVAPNLAYVQLVAPLILAGAGVSMAMPAAQNSVLSSVAGGEIGKASGTFNMLRYLGGGAQAFSEGFALAIGASASLSVVAAIAGLWLPRGVMAPASGASVVRRETQSVPAMSRYQTD